MKVKKFTAKNMPEAMTKVRSELGEDAVILHSKYVDSGGFFGFFTKKSIEVVAAKDESPAPAASKQKREVKEKPAAAEAPPKAKGDLQKEVTELKEMIAALDKNKHTTPSGYPVPVQNIERVLEEQEVEDHLVQQILKQLLADWYRAADVPSRASITQWTKAHIQEMLASIDMGPVLASKPWINLVGPTGVGKTTTAAKIAAHCHLEEKKTVAFITTDTYRIAAVEQLKTYAKILDVPVAVAYSIEDFREAKERFADKDLIIIDSAGRNFTNPQYVKELQKIIDFDEDMQTYLVLSLTSKYKDMKKIFEQFSLISIDRFIFTKKDETFSYGAMLNLMTAANTGAAYVTHGQSVPDDMEKADREKMSEWIVEGYGDE
ncbi:flagellar biosynthesis protein FlhF [Salibacterium aidingense]|uniref:flagellar biosynthesis protein FlhF n=1 Tax=Salibacterium aidingense TaxID=384933 RepID=UPI00041676E8|nr:flagellar biosynthesis protein FlhF [Salibacterium aidingense]